MPIALFLEGGYPFLLILYGGGVCLTMVPLVWGERKKTAKPCGSAAGMVR